MVARANRMRSLSLIFLSRLGALGQNKLSSTSSIHCHVSCYFPWRNSHHLSFIFYYVLRHVVLGFPRLRFPSGCHLSAVLQWLFLFICSTWPIYFHRLVLCPALKRLVSVLFIRSSYGDNIRLSNLYDSSNASKLKCIKLSCISFVHLACFTIKHVFRAFIAWWKLRRTFGRIREQISEINPRHSRGFSPARESSQTLPRFSTGYGGTDNMF